MRYDFEWDRRKERRNFAKHGVSFERAASVFKDPRALSIYDLKHSGDEERWITLGISSTGPVVVVHHTYALMADDAAIIRIISSRKATKKERQQYLE